MSLIWTYVKKVAQIIIYEWHLTFNSCTWSYFRGVSALLRPHGSCLRLWHPEEGAAQLPSYVWQRQWKGKVPRLSLHHSEIPAGDRQQLQHPFPPQHPWPGSPSPRWDLQSGWPDAEIPGRFRKRSHHVPADSGQIGGEGMGGPDRGWGEAVTRKHHRSICVQHNNIQARLALTAQLRELRLVWGSWARVRHQRSTGLM